MTPAEATLLLNGLTAIASRAADAIRARPAATVAHTLKADQSPVSVADEAAEAVILDGLARLVPDIPVISEEAYQRAAPASLPPTFLLVDPLDGTREFVKRNGEFTVNIALIEDGAPVFGVIQAPVGGALWHGEAGRGAFRRDGDEERAIRVRAPAAMPLRVAASRSHRDPRTEALMARIGETETIARGSSLKFCLLAEGGMDVYPRFGPTSEWDTAAGQCILEAAGGAVIDPKGRPLRYNQRDTILNGDFLALGDPNLPWRDWL